MRKIFFSLLIITLLALSFNAFADDSEAISPETTVQEQAEPNTENSVTLYVFGEEPAMPAFSPDELFDVLHCPCTRDLPAGDKCVYNCACESGVCDIPPGSSFGYCAGWDL